MVEIKSLDGSVLRRVEAETLERADLREANLGRADLRGAHLRGADLGRANLHGANLHGANLGGANLHRANLGEAYLHGANLHGANLHGAHLGRANLGGAHLGEANLGRANLHGAYLPNGETWEEYLATVVPALLTAGGKGLAEVVTDQTWGCHSWDNCPMAVAFSVQQEGQCPVLLRPRVREFIRFFDAGLIPRPVVERSEG